MGKAPCEFWADRPGFSFSGEELRQGSFQPCPAQDGASSMAGSSGHDLAHLLQAVLLNGGWCHPLAVFRGGAPWSGEGPLVSATSPEDGRSIPSTLPTVNVLNHIRSRWLKNEGWPICSKVTGDLPDGRDCLP